MLDLVGFRTRYPEFASAEDSLVQAYLDESAARIDPTVWGSWENEGHGLLTAHKLAISPSGQMARLASDKGETTYNKEFTKLQQATGALLRVF